MRSFVPPSAAPLLAVLTLTAAGTAAAVGYGLTAPKRYRATAQLLVSPVAVNDPTFTGLDVLRDTGGTRTAAATAAALLRSPQVADVVRADLGLARSRDSLLNALHARVVDSSDVVRVTAEDTSSAGAAQLANAFADGLVKQRSAGFQSQLAATIRRAQQLLEGFSAAARASGAGVEVAKRLAVLEGFQGQPDPTLRHAGQAVAPASAAWPKLWRLAATGAAAGLAAGLLVSLLLLLGRGAGRRGAGGEAAGSDLGMSEQLVDRLEQRLAERITALGEERERLSGREAALAAREADIAAKLVELRAAAEHAIPGEAPAVGDAEPDDEALAAREALLQKRVAALTQREIELARRAAGVAEREQAAKARTDELAERAAALEETERAARLAQAVAVVPHPEPVREPPARADPPEQAPAALQQADGEEPTGVWNLMVLERLVNDRGNEFPHRRDEWSSYLYFLREYAEPDGTVPASFDWLIQDTFSELVA